MASSSSGSQRDQPKTVSRQSSHGSLQSNLNLARVAYAHLDPNRSNKTPTPTSSMSKLRPDTSRPPTAASQNSGSQILRADSPRPMTASTHDSNGPRPLTASSTNSGSSRNPSAISPPTRQPTPAVTGRQTGRKRALAIEAMKTFGRGLIHGAANSGAAFGATVGNPRMVNYGPRQ